MGKRRKKLVVKESMPEFRSEDEERAYWAEHDVVGYFDWERDRSRARFRR